jgi:hypothetical protein
MHFTGYVKRLNANNSSCNCKNVGTTFDARPTMCIIHQGKENTSKVGCCYMVKSVKVSQSKQHSSQWVPLLRI